MAKGFVGAIKQHRLAIEALRRCYRDLVKRVRDLEEFREVAAPMLVDFRLAWPFLREIRRREIRAVGKRKPRR